VFETLVDVANRKKSHRSLLTADMSCIFNWLSWERLFMVYCPIQEMRDRIVSSMADLMASDPDWREEASRIMEMLDSEDIFALPEGKTPKTWCRSLFQHSALTAPVETAIEREMVPEEYDRPLDMINNVLPTVCRD
jgi:hypothetical protein